MVGNSLAKPYKSRTGFIVSSLALIARAGFGLTPYPAVTFVSHPLRQSRAHVSQFHPPRCPITKRSVALSFPPYHEIKPKAENLSNQPVNFFNCRCDEVVS